MGAYATIRVYVIVALVLLLVSLVFGPPTRAPERASAPTVEPVLAGEPPPPLPSRRPRKAPRAPKKESPSPTHPATKDAALCARIPDVAHSVPVSTAVSYAKEHFHFSSAMLEKIRACLGG